MSLQRITVPPSFLLQCFVFSIQVTGELDPLSFQKLCVHMHWNKSKFERNSSLVYYHIGFARKQNMQAKDVYCVMALYLGLLVMNCYDYQHAQLSFIVFPLFNWLIRLLNPREPQSLRPVYMEGGGGPQIGEVTRGGSPHLSCKRDQIKSEIIWTGRLPHLSGLPHLPGVPHLHVNRPKKTFSLLNLPSVRLFTVPYFS